MRKERPLKSKNSNTSIPHYIPQQHNLDQQMLLDSMVDYGDEDQTDNHHTTKNSHRPTQLHTKTASQGVFLLLDANERLTVRTLHSLSLIHTFFSLLLLYLGQQ